MSEKKDLKEKDLNSVDGGFFNNGVYACHKKCNGKTRITIDKMRSVDGRKEIYCDRCSNWFPASEFSIV